MRSMLIGHRVMYVTLSLVNCNFLSNDSNSYLFGSHFMFTTSLAYIGM